MTDTPLTVEELAELKTLAAVPYVRKDLDVAAWRYSVEPTYESAESSGELRRFSFLLRAHFDKMLATIASLTERAERAEARVAEMEVALKAAESVINNGLGDEWASWEMARAALEGKHGMV